MERRKPILFMANIKRPPQGLGSFSIYVHEFQFHQFTHIVFKSNQFKFFVKLTIKKSIK